MFFVQEGDCYFVRTWMCNFHVCFQFKVFVDIKKVVQYDNLVWGTYGLNRKSVKTIWFFNVFFNGSKYNRVYDLFCIHFVSSNDESTFIYLYSWEYKPSLKTDLQNSSAFTSSETWNLRTLTVYVSLRSLRLWGTWRGRQENGFHFREWTFDPNLRGEVNVDAKEVKRESQ